jgi:acetylornithine/succinyldiaminopimelate/putrescine aminotransferase
MGRTGKLFAFEHEQVIPDVLLLAKAFGGGMPLGAFIASKEIMSCLMNNPTLGHLTTFGGHPVSCTASLAALEQVATTTLLNQVRLSGELFREKLQHPLIREFRGKGLFLALQFESEEINRRVIHQCMEDGLLTDWFLFAPDCMRIAPPLVISEQEVSEACGIILNSLSKIN